MFIYPAIDLRGGQVVRLTEGDYDRMTVYGRNPAQTAAEFQQLGSSHLHIVDLDGAKDGSLANYPAISAIAKDTKLFMEVGGGIRSMERIESYMKLGVQRCILGTAAVRAPAFLREALREFGATVAVGVDVKDGLVAVSGWLEKTEKKGLDFCREMRDLGVATIIYTDISKDGRLAGPNHEIYAELSELKGLNIIASGGVTKLEDVQRLSATGIHGTIIGKALYTGRIALAEALEVVKC